MDFRQIKTPYTTWGGGGNTRQYTTSRGLGIGQVTLKKTLFMSQVTICEGKPGDEDRPKKSSVCKNIEGCQEELLAQVVRGFLPKGSDVSCTLTSRVSYVLNVQSKPDLHHFCVKKCVSGIHWGAGRGGNVSVKTVSNKSIFTLCLDIQGHFKISICYETFLIIF